MSENQSNWIIQATDLELLIRINLTLLVEEEETGLPTFSVIEIDEADMPFQSAKYSTKWHSIFIVNQLKNSDSNKLVSYTYDFGEKHFIPKMILTLDSYNMKISPFKITAYEIHD